MLKQATAIITAFALAACDGPVGTSSGEAGAEDAIDAGSVALVATAPDGTRLWGVKPCSGCRVVYFSASGTQTSHNETCGKNCTRTVIDRVPGND